MASGRGRSVERRRRPAVARGRIGRVVAVALVRRGHPRRTTTMPAPSGPTRSGVFGHSPHARPGSLRLGHTATGVRTLGPGRRIGIWVAGCPLACAGCLTDDGLVPADSGADVAVRAVVEELLDAPDHDGLTISGGEPLWQSGALREVLAAVLPERPEWTVMLYTGWRLEAVAARGARDHVALLRHVDLLVDGPYVAARREPARLWRGSANQRLIPLTAAGAAMVAGRADEGVGIEIQVRDHDVLTIGVPRDRLEHEAVARLLSDLAR